MKVLCNIINNKAHYLLTETGRASVWLKSLNFHYNNYCIFNYLKMKSFHHCSLFQFNRYVTIIKSYDYSFFELTLNCSTKVLQIFSWKWMHRYIFGTSCITQYVVVIKLKYFLTLRQIRYRKQDSLSPPPATTLHHFVFFPFQTPISYSVWCFHSNPTAILFFLFHQNLSNLVSWWNTFKKKDISWN